MLQQPMNTFLSQLSSKEPVPGGGGASALGGAMGAALAGMVANLTVGKKKYAARGTGDKRDFGKGGGLAGTAGTAGCGGRPRL